MCRNLRLVVRTAVSPRGSTSSAASLLEAEPFQSLGVLGTGVPAWAVKCNKMNSNSVLENPFQQLFVDKRHTPHS